MVPYLNYRALWVARAIVFAILLLVELFFIINSAKST
jgi:hypothetical protein